MQHSGVVVCACYVSDELLHSSGELAATAPRYKSTCTQADGVPAKQWLLLSLAASQESIGNAHSIILHDNEIAPATPIAYKAPVG